MATFTLTPLETRIIGCLIEKERLTPENYPLSLNSLTAACNQSTNRDPVSSYDEKMVEAGLDSLRQKKLATVVFGAGSRVQKYRHNLLDHFELDRREIALLCVLLLRGPQTPGELRARAERMSPFGGIDEVESSLAGLSKDSHPLVRLLPARPGQKERRYVQLLSGEPEWSGGEEQVEHVPAPPEPSRLETLERELTGLKDELRRLREEFDIFRNQFG